MTTQCPKCNADNSDTQKFCGECAAPLQPSKEIGITRTIETSDWDFTRGTLFAERYEIIEELGKGGMGNVYRVEDTKTKEEIALKLIKPEIASDKNTIDRFRNELTTARKIRHLNVCGMYDLGEHEGTHFITMEYVSGQDLKGLIRQTGQLAVGTTVSIAKQICNGLSEAHKLGVVHRDLKPSNIMINKEGDVRIMDFGIARSLKAKGITKAGAIIGTPDYISPEQVDGKDVDQRADTYSLGVILYEMVTGRVPFEGDTALSIAYKHKHEAPQDPRKINAQIPEDLSHLILKCLEKDKESRFQSAGELQLELENIEKGIPTTDREIPRRKPLTSKEITVTFGLKKLLLPALVLVAVVIVAVVIWQPWSKKEPTPIPSDKPTLAILYFENNSGDEGLNNWRDALPALLITDLQQSRYLHVLGGDRIYEILKKLNLMEEDKYSTSDLKRIASEGKASHIVYGNYITAGEKFIINVSLIKADTVETLDSLKEEGMGEESITFSVDNITMKVKSALNLSTEQITSDIDRKIGAITSSSSEAYKYFVEGVKQLNNGNNRQSIYNMNKAVSNDPNFAMAYRYLSRAYLNMGQKAEGIKYIKKAFELRDRLSERERYQIEGSYYEESIKSLDKAIEAYNKKLQLYPDDFLANNILGDIYTTLEEWDKAIEALDVRLRAKDVTWWPFYHVASPYSAKGMYDKAEELLKYCLNKVSKNLSVYHTLASLYLCQGKYDLAHSSANKVTSSIDEARYNRLKLKGDIYHCQEDFLSSENEYDKLSNSKDVYLLFSRLSRLGSLSLSQGRFKESLDYLNKAVEFARQRGEISWEVSINNFLAYVYLRSDNPEYALKENQSAFATAIENDLSPIKIKYLTGLIWLKIKPKEEVQKIASELKQLINEGMNKKKIRYYYNLMGLIELQSENFSVSIENFEKSKSLVPFQHTKEYLYETADQAIFYDSLASCYYKTGDINRAKDEYEKISRLTTGRLFYGDIYAKSFYMLGKIYEEQGDTAKATEHYEKFLDLWKNADPGIAEVDDARERLAGLRAE